MNLWLTQISKISKIFFPSTFGYRNIIKKNYYCEKWIREQEINKLKSTNKISIESLNLNQKEMHFDNQIKKILEQNNKILSNQLKQNAQMDWIKKIFEKNVKKMK